MLTSVKEIVKTKIYNLFEHSINSIFEKKFDEYSYKLIQLQQFYNAPKEMLYSYVTKETIISDIVERFEKLGITVRREKICINEFEDWLKEYSELTAFYENWGDVKIEKLLEHYLTSKYLNVDSNMIYIDIAAASSPFSTILDRHLNGGGYYCLDLSFEKGIHGNKIGSDAGNMPLEDNSADVMALHCAFECFQGDSDICFVKEADRVLKYGGRFGIIPLYVDNTYFVMTGPKCDKRKISVEPEAKCIWRDDNYDREPFSRHYSPESFKTRIIDNISGMVAEIIYFVNLDELRKNYDGSRIYCSFMFKATKMQYSSRLNEW